MPFLPNPWLLLAAAAAIAGAGALGYSAGREAGSDAVQVRWDQREAALASSNAELARAALRASGELQRGVDDDRRRQGAVVEGLRADLERVSGELRERAARPAFEPARASAPAIPGPALCTGLGLYREDGLFLAGEAATGKRVKLQRDDCYAAYGRAKAELEGTAAAAGDR